MDQLDVPSLLQVSAAFNIAAVLGWLALGQVFRVAPRASRLMAAAHLMRIVAAGLPYLPGDWPWPLRVALGELVSLAGVTLLLLALRRMLRGITPVQDVALLTLAGLLGALVSLVEGQPRGAALAASAAITLLALLGVRDLLRGLRQQLPPAAIACLILPFVALALVGLTRSLEFLSEPHWQAYFPEGQLPPAGRVLGWLLLAMAISLTLMTLMVWRLLDRIRHLTRSDPLTGTRNRRAFEQALAEAWALRQRGRGYAVAMLDIDHFKRVNDRLGHAAGDAALRQMVNGLQPCLREVDRFGRLGGEEFCVLLPDTSLAGTALVAERMRIIIASAPLQWLGQDWPLSASFGIAAAESTDADADAVLARADAALYRAKGQGRNVVQG